jgi:hypothetical protein
MVGKIYKEYIGAINDHDYIQVVQIEAKYLIYRYINIPTVRRTFQMATIDFRSRFKPCYRLETLYVAALNQEDEVGYLELT